MDKAGFDWTLIRSFLAVLEAGSLTAAAQRLGAQQPTLGRHVAELEAQLGGALFERTGRGLAPTALALRIAEAAGDMQRAADVLRTEVLGQQSAATGTVRVTASAVVACWLLPEILRDLQQAEPEIQIELVASNQLSNLLRREADIAVRMVRPEQGSLVARKLLDIGIGCYAHRDYLAQHGEPRTLADILTHRLIGMDQDEVLLRGFAQMGLAATRESFALRTDDQVTYCRLLAAGAGLGFATHYVAAQLPGLVRLLPGLPVPPLPCWLAVHREIRGNRVIRRAYDFLAEAITARVRLLEAGS
jgi:DNA-binding transcriptional LysR family regulator